MFKPISEHVISMPFWSSITECRGSVSMLSWTCAVSLCRDRTGHSKSGAFLTRGGLHKFTTMSYFSVSNKTIEIVGPQKWVYSPKKSHFTGCIQTGNDLVHEQYYQSVNLPTSFQQCALVFFTLLVNWARHMAPLGTHIKACLNCHSRAKHAS